MKSASRATRLKEATGDRRDDADFVAGFNGGFEVLEETDVFIVQVHVHETVELVGSLEQARLDAAGLDLEVAEHLADRCAGGLDHVNTVRVIAEWRGNADFHGHGSSCRS